MSDLSYKAKVAARAALALVLALVAATTVTAAQAADTNPDPTAAAREHYQKGTSFYDLGRYPEAIREFEEAYQLKNDPALLYNLAQSHRLAGNSEQALHFYRTYLRRVPKAANRVEIEGRIAALEQIVSQKTATQTTPPNQTIPPSGGGTGSATPPPTGDLPPGGAGTGAGPNGTGTGPTAGTGTGPTTTPGGTGTTPPPPPPPPGSGAGSTTSSGGGWPSSPPPQTPPPDPGKRFRTIGTWTAIGGGALFLIGLIEGGRAAAAGREIEDAAKNGGAFDPRVESRGKSAERAEVFLLVTGTLVAAGGGALYYYGRRKSEQAAPTVATISMAPVVSASTAGALLRVTF